MQGTSQRWSQNQGQSPAEIFRNAEKVENGAGMAHVDP